MKTDKDGFEFIRSFEKYSATPYQCQAGKWTIGYGHTEHVTADASICTRPEADELLADDIKPCEKALIRLLTIDINQWQFNALVSLIFNIGETNFKNSGLLQKLNSGDRQGAAKDFVKFIYYKDPKSGIMCVSPGLRNRREKERDLFLTQLKLA